MNKTTKQQIIKATVNVSIALALRGLMYKKGMIKSYFLPCAIKKPNTFR